jgi:hypothetical protein
LRRKLLGALTGSPDGHAAWIAEIAEGDDEGFFGPESAAWEVHAAMPTLVAGIRALLMQTLHPGAMAGVHDWSRYKSDPLGRLTGTIRWIVATTFGSTDMARRESARVRAIPRSGERQLRRDRDRARHSHLLGPRSRAAALGAPGVHRGIPRLPGDLGKADTRWGRRLRARVGDIR